MMTFVVLVAAGVVRVFWMPIQIIIFLLALYRVTNMLVAGLAVASNTNAEARVALPPVAYWPERLRYRLAQVTTGGVPQIAAPQAKPQYTGNVIPDDNGDDDDGVLLLPPARR